ncbi:sugar kinase (plasmid) [Deinococcus metallilatus]|uniref:2-dehydro-3-deoxygluconokinase n=1 Tax=Deinococcus metallilatus TaxID=1211322 RepID=A0ABR6MYD0_9DEIO|nr:sugar kinase [Deinococcus metallilatus]MBB5296943.1 2-dehydro-3-deoxygluconokinase [Deinococcus metallilatus]QBY06689.1 sugar kinase [Deinococcus metallilatus]GMA15158.1 2-dehydro-3-deoxygluconokinase [Deinococcus metallilatus]
MSEAPVSVLTFGEALLKLVLPPAQRLETMSRLEAQCAGAELNVAAALAALGRPAAWVGALPSGPLGEWVRGHVRGLKVDDLALTREGRLGTFYLEDHHPPRPSRVVYDRGGSAFTHLTAADFDPAWLAGRAAFHVSGISLALGAGPRDLALRLMGEARAAGLTVSFDVNHRRLLLAEDAALEVYAPALRLADLIFVAGRDTPMLGGLAGLRDLAPDALIVQTRGAEGSLALMPGGQTFPQPVLAASGPGRVGRGDAFAGGFLHASLNGESAADALAFATATAALKTTTPGDQLQATEAEVWAVLEAGHAGEPVR